MLNTNEPSIPPFYKKESKVGKSVLSEVIPLL